MALRIHTKTGILFSVGAVLVAASAIFIVFWLSWFSEQIKEQLVLTNTSQSFEMWEETPVPMYLEIFLYNFTNSAEVLADPDNVVPSFTEMGPYTFRDEHFKTNITWNDNGTVTYFNKRVWNFEPDKSNGSLTDEVTNVNIVIATATFSSRYQSTIMKLMLNVILNTRSFIITKTAGEWLFDGFEDELLILGNIFPGQQMPDRFGFFYGRNNSEIFDGQFDMLTGATDLGALGILSGWRGANRTGLWKGACGEVRGSAGELFAPRGPTNPMDQIEIFASDLCTYFALKQNGSKEVNGITGDLFIADDSVFDNGHRFPSQACYCHEPRDETCVPSGALNVSECKLGAPAFMSFPHFFQADEFYNSRVDGLSPSIDDQCQVALEPLTGMPLYVKAQLQINVMLRRSQDFGITKTMPDNVFIPMLWFRQEITVTDDFASQARTVLFLRWGVIYIGYAVTGLGIIFVIAGVILLLKHLWRSEEKEPLLCNQS